MFIYLKSANSTDYFDIKLWSFEVVILQKFLINSSSKLAKLLKFVYVNKLDLLAYIDFKGHYVVNHTPG